MGIIFVLPDKTNYRRPMRNIYPLLSAFFFLVSGTTIAHSQYHKFEIAIAYGVMADAHDKYEVPKILVANHYSFIAGYYFSPAIGLHSGVKISDNLEGSDRYFACPIYISAGKTFHPDGNHSITPDLSNGRDFIFSMLGALRPGRLAVYAGPTLGSIQPSSSITMSKAADGDLYKNGYTTDTHFALTLDAGIRASYMIWRFALDFNFGASYLATNNIRFESEIHPQNGYQPDWFVNISGGLSFHF